MGMIYLYSHTPKKGVKHVDILSIEYLRPKLSSSYDAIIFTSKNAVFALDDLAFRWKKLPCYVIGKGTAKAVKELGGKVEFISELGYGEDFAKTVKNKLQSKKVLFPRAKEVVTNIKELLSGVNVDEKIVYKTSCNEKLSFQKPPAGAICIFASPSCVKCFLKHFSLDASYKVICIGKKTKDALPHGIDALMPNEQSLDACISLAKNLLKN